MSNPSVSSAPADAWAFGPSRTDLILMLTHAIDVLRMNRKDAADRFALCYADGLGIAQCHLDDYRFFSAQVDSSHLRLRNLLSLS